VRYCYSGAKGRASVSQDGKKHACGSQESHPSKRVSKKYNWIQ
jgi:hypothetical protein